MAWSGGYEMNELKKCPFCGGHDIRHYTRNGVITYHHLECDTCLCGTGEEESYGLAVDAWNNRADECKLCDMNVMQEEIDRLIAENKQLRDNCKKCPGLTYLITHSNE
jgi:Lar family restriction alleviation protein